ncbi:hypothetical protein E2C01_022061 [Portunus trituberculatus]|uniref:Uncharacterized protein n=1 Tax=Portunus trituberculatus TaxID=210409 RepID=A0A5B7E606_PORTR|nr:hypothetical protein [Portunus trituberculatus]
MLYLKPHTTHHTLPITSPSASASVSPYAHCHPYRSPKATHSKGITGAPADVKLRQPSTTNTFHEVPVAIDYRVKYHDPRLAPNREEDERVNPISDRHG